MKNQTELCSEWTWDRETVDPCKGQEKSRFVKTRFRTQNCSACAKCKGYHEKTFNHSALILYDVKTNNRTVAESACKELNSELYTGYELVGIGNWNESLVVPTQDCGAFTAFWTGFILDWESQKASIPGKRVYISANCTTEIWGPLESNEREPNGQGHEDLLFLSQNGQFFDAPVGFCGIVVCDDWVLDEDRSVPCS